MRKTHSIIPKEETKNATNDEEIIKFWDKAYMERSNNYPKVAICKVWNKHLYLDTPPILTEKTLRSVFGRIPGVQNPPALKGNEWDNFQKLILNKVDNKKSFQII